MTAISEEGYLIQVVRVCRRGCQTCGERLSKDSFADNPYYQHIYKDESSDTMQVFQIYAGHGFYHSLTQGHKYIFSIGQGENSEVRAL